MSCLLIGNEGKLMLAAKSAALRWKGCQFHAVASWADARQIPASATDLVVFANGDKSGAEQAAQTLDTTGMRPWATVLLGESSSVVGVESVSPDECTEPVLARVFEGAVAIHRLQRENARLQGDLRTLAHRISHDQKAPLGGISSACELLLERLQDASQKEDSISSSIFESIDELSRLIERVSFVVKSSINPIVKVPVDMRGPVWVAQQQWESRILKSQASITEPEVWPHVPGVARFLETIWWNLLGNALTHAGDSPRVELGWDEENHHYRFWIRDNGQGIPASLLHQLFQPFHTLHETNSKRGLGLSIVHRLVELQGGSCGYEYLAGRGSQFHYTLPKGTVASPLDRLGTGNLPHAELSLQ